MCKIPYKSYYIQGLLFDWPAVKRWISSSLIVDQQSRTIRTDEIHTSYNATVTVTVTVTRMQYVDVVPGS